MGRKQASNDGPVKRRTPRRVLALYWAAPFAAALASVGGVLLFHQFEQFVITDQRFHFPPPPDFGSPPPNLEVRGVTHASKTAIDRTFEGDFGRSLYLFPYAERRRNLLAVDWVKDATVSRRWPNRVAVTVAERQPAAFIELPAGRNGAARWSLIDEDGVILPPPPGARFNLPVLVGVSDRNTGRARRDRVRLMVRLMRDIGPLGERISEVDVTTPSSLKVVALIGGKVLTLELGNERFRQRLERFFLYYPGIEKRLPAAREFDLRLDPRIIAKEGVQDGE